MNKKLIGVTLLLVLSLVSACNMLEIEVEPTAGATEVSPSPTPEPAPPSPTPNVPTPTPVPPAHPAAGVIYNTGEGLWAIDASGIPRLLLDQPDSRLSPDGSRAAYVSYNVAGAGDVWLADLVTGEQRNLTDTPDRFEEIPMWWPGGPDVLVFGSDIEMGMANAGYPTVVGLDGIGYQILDSEEGGPIALSSYGQMLAYGGYDNLGKIYYWNRDPGAEVFDPVAYGLSVEKLYQPAWSPSGRHLAWKVGGDLTGDGLFQLGVAVFDMIQGTAELFHVYEPIGGTFPHYLAWHPDGTHLALVTFQEPPATGREPNLWIIDTGTGDEIYVGAGADPVWSPDGGRLAFSRMEGETVSIAVADAGTGQILDLDLPATIRYVSGWIDPLTIQSSPSTSIPRAGAPDACSPHDDLRAYFDPQGRYCLLYPAYFQIGDTTEDHVVFYGPPLDESIEPVMGMLVILVEDAPAGRMLDEVVDDYVATQYISSPVTRESMTLSGAPAVRVEGTGERSGGRTVVTLHDGETYYLSVYPVDERFPQAAPDVDALWRAASESFTFIHP